ncbi:hypothetical protein CsSME_00023669 [Camellia sinensis var. sinensis]
MVFNQQPINPHSVIFRVAKDSCEHASALQASYPTPSRLNSHRTPDRVWIPPRQGRFKANCDVALRPGTSRASVAVIFRNSSGSVVEEAARFEDVGSILQGETLAIRWACLMARSLNLSQVEIAGDNNLDIRIIAKQCNLSFVWTPREANSAAHWIARAFLNGVLLSNWVINPPVGLCKALALC